MLPLPRLSSWNPFCAGSTSPGATTHHGSSTPASAASSSSPFRSGRASDAVFLSSSSEAGAGSSALARELLSGCLAGVVEYTSCQPIDIIATRRMLATGVASKQSMVADLMDLVREGGVGRVYRGLGPQLMAALPATCGMYAGERGFSRVFALNDAGDTNAQRTFAAGFCSGVTETLSVCPFEVIKVRLQSKKHVGKYKNTMDCFRQVVRDEGPMRLYSGAVAHSYRNCIFNGTFFAGCYIIAENVRDTEKETASQAFAFDMISGFVMGIIATPLKMPFFVCKTRMQENPPGPTGKYGSKGVFGVMGQIAEQEGTAALWKGTASASMRMATGGAVCLACFRGFSKALEPES